MVEVAHNNGTAGPTEVPESNVAAAPAEDVEPQDQGLTRGDMEGLALEFEEMDKQGYHLALVDVDDGKGKPWGRQPRKRLVWHDSKCVALGGLSLTVEPTGMAFPPPPISETGSGAVETDDPGRDRRTEDAPPADSWSAWAPGQSWPP